MLEIKTVRLADGIQYVFTPKALQDGQVEIVILKIGDNGLVGTLLNPHEMNFVHAPIKKIFPGESEAEKYLTEINEGTSAELLAD